jgi:hypothetical protein
MRSQPSRTPVVEEGLTRLDRTKGISLRNIAQAISFVLALMMLRAIALAQEPDQSSQQPQPAPIERADELKSKATFAVYYVPNEVTYDINLRHQFGSVVAWIGGLIDPKGGSQGRVGAEYDFQHEWLLFIPTLQVATNGAVMGSFYSEFGTDYYGIFGYSRTNLRPFNNLTFDPNDSVQIGLGHKISSYDKLYAFSIIDVRLHTHQQDTHILWRHRLDDNNGITIDGLYKSGNTDEGKHIRAVGIGIYYDRPTWFWKAYYDPYVNFTQHTMVRLGIGLKF